MEVSPLLGGESIEVTIFYADVSIYIYIHDVHPSCNDHFLEPDTFQHSAEVLADLIVNEAHRDIVIVSCSYIRSFP